MAPLWFSSKVALCIVLTIFSLTPTESQGSAFPRFPSSWSFNNQQARPPHDITSKSGLNSLYNKHVVEAERVVRPLNFLPVAIGPLSHSGVRVTLDDGSKYLIHKGNGFGLSSQTVVVDAKHMSDKWTVKENKPMSGKTVGDLVKRGGSSYSILGNNCHGAAKSMMKD